LHQQQKKQQQQQQQQQPQQQQQVSVESQLPLAQVPVADSSCGPAELSHGSTPQQTADAPGSTAVQAATPAQWAAEQSARWAGTDDEQLHPLAQLQQGLDDRTLFGGKGKHGNSRRRQPTEPQQPQQQQQQQAIQQEQGQLRQSDELYSATDKEASSRSRPQGSRRHQQGGSHRQGAPQRRSSKADGPLGADDDSEAAPASPAASGQADVNTPAAAAAAAAPSQRQGGDVVTTSAGGSVLDGAAERGMESSSEPPTASRVKEAANHPEATEVWEKRQSQTDEQHNQQQQQQPAAQQSHQQQQHGQEAAATTARATRERPLGFSGDAAFTAAAKSLSSGKPNRNLLLGCLEAIDMQQQELRQRLAEKAAMAAIATAAARRHQLNDARHDPLAKQLMQLQQDFERAKQRSEDEKAGVQKAAVADVVRALLPLLDSFDAALAARQAKKDEQLDIQGAQEYLVYEALHNQLLSILR
jgi:hypothetical protein